MTGKLTGHMAENTSGNGVSRLSMSRKTLMASVVAVGLVATLAGCGGGRGYSGSSASHAFATGPIYSACMAADRKAATSSTCGCVQAVANQKLSGSDQSKAVAFFKDPHKSQETRQSDNPLNEAFWKRYKAFGDSAQATCG
ncbi:arginine transporter [Celeribacter marinus]|uniref:arginine transporter n=1 Tax=Celeribacter marinus TaxID=1397108 RepID=UPI003F6CADDB